MISVCIAWAELTSRPGEICRARMSPGRHERMFNGITKVEASGAGHI